MRMCSLTPLALPTLLITAAVTIAGCKAAQAPVPSTGTELQLPEHYAQSIAALGRPGASRAFQIGQGSVASSGEVALEWRLPGGPDAPRSSPVAFESDGVPVAHWSIRSASVEVAFEAAAGPLPALGDSSLVLSVRATARAIGGSVQRFVLETRIRPAPDGPHFVPWDAAELGQSRERWNGHAVLRDGRLIAIVDGLFTPRPAAHLPDGGVPGSLSAAATVELAPGESRHWDFWLPLYPASVSAAALARSAAHEAVVAESRGWWRHELASASQLHTPDSLANLAWRASIVTLLLCHERHAGRWVPIGNPFQYRDVWIRDAARMVRALAVAGLGEYARDDALTLAQFQFPNGALLSQRGQLDGTGQAIWAFDQAASLLDSDDLARELAPVAAEGLTWIERNRAAMGSATPDWPGLLPFAEPRDGELVRAQLSGNDAWGIAGCDAAAALARRAGWATLEQRARTAAREYRAAFASALARCRARDIPPSWQGIGRDWGNLSAAYPTRAVAPGDPHMEVLAARIWARGGDSGLTCYGPDDSLHTYNGADLAQWALLAGRPAEAHRWLAGVLAHSSSTLGQAEIFSRHDGGFGANLPPHGTAAAMLVDLIRNLLIEDSGDTVLVALGAPQAWWTGTQLTDAPTRFGVASLALSRPAPNQLVVRVTPLPVAIRVRVPDGLRAVDSSTPGARVLSGRWIDVPPRTASVEFSVVPQREDGR